MNDTVREELETKIGRISGPLAPPIAESPKIDKSPVERPLIQQPVKAKPVVTATPSAPVIPPPAPRTFTGEIGIKKTSPTLVDFQPKSPSVPDWRLQLQNSVRQRSSGSRAVAMQVDAISEPVLAKVEQPTINGALALKNEAAPVLKQPEIQTNDRVANALKRIEAARKAHLSPEHQVTTAPATVPSSTKREHPFNVVARTAVPQSTPSQPVVPDEARSAPEPRQKPRLVSSLRIEKRNYDTNKLPPIPAPTPISSSFDINISNRKSGTLDVAPEEEVEIDQVLNEQDAVGNENVEIDELDDLAPFALRFASGLFDVSVAAMASIIILSPVMAGAESWFTASGVLLFSATLAIVLFLYLTASISFWGRSFGMRLFSLELIDAEQNVLPTVHQSAVSSAVFLLSLATGGLGFIPIFFTEEKRAVHDIVSGTLIIRDI